MENTENANSESMSRYTHFIIIMCGMKRYMGHVNEDESLQITIDEVYVFV